MDVSEFTDPGGGILAQGDLLLNPKGVPLTLDNA